MKVRIFAMALAIFSLSGGGRALDTWTPGGSKLPTELTMKTILNETPRHGEWHQVPAGPANVQSYIVYPDRSDKAPVLLVTAENQKLTDWLRAVADQVAQEGFIAVVPDLLAGDVTLDAVRDYALRLPAANGTRGSLRFTADASGQSRMEVVVAGQPRQAGFSLQEQSWPAAITFLNRYANNHPTLIVLPTHSHMAHAAMEFLPQGQGGAPAPAYPTGKPDDLPAGLLTAKSALARSQIRAEWVDIPMGATKLHTKITYPQGGGRAPIVIVMHHAPGLDPAMEAVSDQLSREGFIAILPDLLSGMGPNGGNTPSFQFEDEIMKANGRLGAEEIMRRYKFARDYGMKLPEANGKSASLGFCAGGGSSFRFAGEVPELNAAVVFYGGPPDEATMAKIKAPVLAFAGTDDVRVAAGIEGAVEKMKNLQKAYETHIYPHATHSFIQYQNLGGNTQATADAWPRSIAFLKQYTR